MSKTIYLYNANNSSFAGIKLVEDSYQLGAGETTVAIKPGLIDPKFVNESWQGETVDEVTATGADNYKKIVAAHPDLLPQPTDEQKGLTALALENAQLKQQLDQLTQAVTAIAQTAPITEGDVK